MNKYATLLTIIALGFMPQALQAGDLVDAKQSQLNAARQREADALTKKQQAIAELQQLKEGEARLRKVPAPLANYDGQPCYYFNRPTLETTPRGTRQNVHPNNSWVCHQDQMYLCQSGKWANRGPCNEWGSLESRQRMQSHVLEGVSAPVKAATSPADKPISNNRQQPQVKASAESDNPFR